MHSSARALFRSVVVGLAFAGLSAGAAAQQKFVNILTGGQSGVYYPLGVALGQIYGKAHAGHQDERPGDQGLGREPEPAAGRPRRDSPSRSATRCPTRGRATRTPASRRRSTKLRTVAGIYPNYIQIVASADSGIKTLADLKGKRISVGAPRSGTELNARAILKAAGMSYKDFAKVEYLPFGESVELIKNRQLDVTLQSAGLGVASIRDLATSVKINVVSASRPTSSRRSATRRTRQPRSRPTRTARTRDRRRCAVKNFLVTHEGVPADTVYAMTKAVFTNLDQLAAAHSAAKAISAAERRQVARRFRSTRAPRSYYREAGLSKVIRSQAVPIEDGTALAVPSFLRAER